MGLAGVWVVGGGDVERREGEEEGEGPRRWRRRSVASEGVRTGRVDQDVAVEREVVERAGEEAVKVALVVSVVEVDGDAVRPWVGCVSSMESNEAGCSTSVMVEDASSVVVAAPATACSDISSGKGFSSIVSLASTGVSESVLSESCDSSSSDSSPTCSTMIKGSVRLETSVSSATTATGFTGVKLDCSSFVMFS